MLLNWHLLFIGNLFQILKDVFHEKNIENLFSHEAWQKRKKAEQRIWELYVIAEDKAQKLILQTDNDASSAHQERQRLWELCNTAEYKTLKSIKQTISAKCDDASSAITIDTYQVARTGEDIGSYWTRKERRIKNQEVSCKKIYYDESCDYDGYPNHNPYESIACSYFSKKSYCTQNYCHLNTSNKTYVDANIDLHKVNQAIEDFFKKNVETNERLMKAKETIAFFTNTLNKISEQKIDKTKHTSEYNILTTPVTKVSEETRKYICSIPVSLWKKIGNKNFLKMYYQVAAGNIANKIENKRQLTDNDYTNAMEILELASQHEPELVSQHEPELVSQHEPDSDS